MKITVIEGTAQEIVEYEKALKKAVVQKPVEQVEQAQEKPVEQVEQAQEKPVQKEIEEPIQKSEPKKRRRALRRTPEDLKGYLDNLIKNSGHPFTLSSIQKSMGLVPNGPRGNQIKKILKEDADIEEHQKGAALWYAVKGFDFNAFFESGEAKKLEKMMPNLIPGTFRKEIILTEDNKNEIVGIIKGRPEKPFTPSNIIKQIKVSTKLRPDIIDFLQRHDEIDVYVRNADTLSRPRTYIGIKGFDFENHFYDRMKDTRTKLSVEEDGRRMRINFLNARAKWLQYNYQWDREKAMNYAALEWEKNGGIKSIRDGGDEPTVDHSLDQATVDKVKNDWTIQDEFPKLPFVTEENEHKVIETIKSLFISKGKLGYFDFKEILGLENGLEWLQFLDRFTLNLKKVANYFCCSNKFKVQKIDGYDYIVYVNES